MKVDIVTKRQREAMEPKKQYPIPQMCSFALGRGKYCTGDDTKPDTHDAKCPRKNFSRDVYFD